jgi:hypothetical protein
MRAVISVAGTTSQKRDLARYLENTSPKVGLPPSASGYLKGQGRSSTYQPENLTQPEKSAKFA